MVTTREQDAVRQLDVVTIGRASVDLYGQQIGSRLEDIETFAKSVGGCPTNIAVGTSRLGLKAALITRVGDEQMGRFIKEQLTREGVETRGIVTDPDRLTALVLLSVEAEGVSPMIFFRSDCADMALDESDIDEELIASARAIVVTGTHFSTANAAAAQRKAIRIAKSNGGKVVFDIDYRPSLWGLAGHAAGFERYVKSERVTRAYQAILPDADLVVGTEEEILVVAGADTLAEALAGIRTLTSATIVLKRGAKGCIIYDGHIPTDLELGIVGDGFPIEIFNVLGAGDAFMSGFLRGWLRGEPHTVSATWANACGAFAVSRLLCAPEYPTWRELGFFLEHGSKERALRKDEALNHLHRTTTRRIEIPRLMAFAIDHRLQLETLPGATPDRLASFKRLAVRAALRVANGRPGYGMLLDDKYGRDALFDAAQAGNLWIAKPLELPGSRPLRFEFTQDVGSRLVEWPIDHCIKVLCFYRPDDPSTLKADQLERLRQVYDAARAVRRDLLIEIISSSGGPLDDTITSRALDELYDAGLKPDWWKLEPQISRLAWENIDRVIDTRDPLCRGVVLLGLEASQKDLELAFATASTARSVKGFAVGRTIFAPAIRAWLDGTMNDEQAIADMAERFQALTDIWMQLGSNKPSDRIATTDRGGPS